MTSAIVHVFNSTDIRQLSTDGYVNATAMCQAHGKLFADYFRLKGTQKYLEALSRSTGIPISLDSDMGIHTSELVRSIKGGDPKLQGTWVHPKVAIHLAQWCSPQFAVFVTDLVFDWMSRNAVLPEEEMEAEWSWEAAILAFLLRLCRELGDGMEHDDCRVVATLGFAWLNSEDLGDVAIADFLKLDPADVGRRIARLQDLGAVADDRLLLLPPDLIPEYALAEADDA